MFKAISYASDFPVFFGGDRVATSSEISSRHISGDANLRPSASIGQLQQQQEKQQQLDVASPTQSGEKRNCYKAGCSLRVASFSPQPAGPAASEHQRSRSEVCQKSQLNDADDSINSGAIHNNNGDLTSALPAVVKPLILDGCATTTTPATPQQLPAAKDALLLSNVPVKDPGLRPALAALLPQIRALSMECFHEDVTQYITKKTGWKLNLLVTPDESRLLGFLSYRFHGESNSFVEVSKVAICADCRRSGYGHHIMKDILATAKKTPSVQYVSLSSLAETVGFYQHLGFVRHDDIKFVYSSTDANEEIVENQVYMEKKVRNCRKKKTGKQKTKGKKK